MTYFLRKKINPSTSIITPPLISEIKSFSRGKAIKDHEATFVLLFQPDCATKTNQQLNNTEHKSLLCNTVFFTLLISHTCYLFIQTIKSRGSEFNTNNTNHVTFSKQICQKTEGLNIFSSLCFFYCVAKEVKVERNIYYNGYPHFLRAPYRNNTPKCARFDARSEIFHRVLQTML